MFGMDNRTLNAAPAAVKACPKAYKCTPRVRLIHSGKAGFTAAFLSELLFAVRAFFPSSIVIVSVCNYNRTLPCFLWWILSYSVCRMQSYLHRFFSRKFAKKDEFCRKRPLSPHIPPCRVQKERHRRRYSARLP